MMTDIPESRIRFHPKAGMICQIATVRPALYCRMHRHADAKMAETEPILGGLSLGSISHVLQ